MKTSRGKVIRNWTVLFVLAMIPVGAFWYTFRQETLQSDPGEVRSSATLVSSWGIYDSPEYLNPWAWFFGSDPTTTFSGRLTEEEFEIEKDKTTVQLSIDNEDHHFWNPKPPLQTKPDPATPYQIITEDKVELNLEHIVVSYKTSAEQWLHQVFALPELSRLPADQEKQWLEDHYVMGGSYMCFPYLTLHITGKNLDKIADDGHQVFNLDNQNNVFFHNLYSKVKGGNSEKLVRLPIQQWHPSRLLVGLSIDSQKSTTRSLNLKTKEADFDHFKIGIFHTQQIKGLWRFASLSEGLTYEFTRYLDGDNTKPGTLIGFEVYDCKHRIGDISTKYTLRHPDESGSQQVIEFETRGDRLHFAQAVRHRWQDIEKIDFTIKELNHFAVFELPFLPGLPKANQNVSNLFKLEIPYVEWNYNPFTYLSQAAQIPSDHSIELKEDVEPITYQNRTLQHILKSEMKRHNVFRIKRDGAMEAEEFSPDWVMERFQRYLK